MEVYVKPEVQAKLDQMARELLDRRYDDLESDEVKLISGDELKARLRAKSDSRRGGLSQIHRAVHVGWAFVPTVPPRYLSAAHAEPSESYTVST
jgi:hypothetical protein